MKKEVLELTVDISSAKLAGGRLLLEEVINLSEGSILGLGKEEEDPDHPEQTKAEVEHASLRTPVPRSRIIVEHAGIELLDGNLTTDVEGTTNDDGLGTDTRRGHLTHDNIGGRAKRDLESDLNKDEENSHWDGNVCGVFYGKSHDANDEHAEADGGRAVKVEGTAAN